MNQWNITAVRQQDREKYGSFVLTEWKNIAFEPETELLVAFCSGAAHGALLARTGHSRYEVVSLFVEEGSRRRGAASALLEAAERSGTLRGCGTLRAVYAVPEAEKDMLHRFFLTRGFVLPREGAALYTLPVRSLERSYLAKLPAASQHALAHIVPMENYLARSNALVRAMADAGFGTSLCLEPGASPYLLWSPREGMEISVCYRVKNEEYTEFSLTAQLLVRVERTEDAERIAQIMREDPGPGLLRPSDEEYLFGLCAVRSEGAVFAPEESVEGFLMDFSAQAQRLVRLPGIRTVIYCQNSGSMI